MTGIGETVKTFNKNNPKIPGDLAREYYNNQLEEIKRTIEEGGRTSIGSSSYQYQPRDQEPLSYKCHKLATAIVYSPLVCMGSGNGAVHPESKNIYTFSTVRRCELPLTNADLIRDGFTIYIAPVGSFLSYGDTIVSLKTTIDGKEIEEVLCKWNNMMIGVLQSVDERISDLTDMSTLYLRFTGMIYTLAEKLRAPSIKSRLTNLCNNMIIYLEGCDPKDPNGLIFDPSRPLRDPKTNELLQLQVILSTEEAKTKNAALSLVSEECALKGKPIIYNCNGFFINLDEGVKAIEENLIRVTIDRWDLEPTFYTILKRLYQNTKKNLIFDDEEVVFIDEEKRIIHHNARAVIGICAGKIETPYTAQFFGSVNSYCDSYVSQRIDFEKHGEFIMNFQNENTDGVERTQRCVIESFNEGQEILEQSSIIDEGTLIKETNMKVCLLKYRQANILHTLYIPSISTKGLFSLQKQNKMFKKKDFITFMVGEINRLVLDIPTVTQYLNGNSRIKLSIISLFKAFSIPLEDRDDSWATKVITIITNIKFLLQTYINISDALYKKVTRSSRKVYFTARVATTTCGFIRTDEIHIHPVTLQFMNIKDPTLRISINKEGKRIIDNDAPLYIGSISRVPVSSFTHLKVVSNEMVSPFLVALNVATMAFSNEGDADGDSLAIRVVKEGGVIEIPTLPLVNPIGD